MKNKNKAPNNNSFRNLIVGATLAGVIGGGAGTAAYEYHKDKVRSTQAERQAEKQAKDRELLLQDADKAREAIAKRYGECAVKAIVNKGEDKKHPGTQKIDISFATSVTPDAKRYEEKYANGKKNANMVTWTPTELMARESIPGHTGDRAMGAEIGGTPLNRTTPQGNAYDAMRSNEMTFIFRPADRLSKGDKVNLYLNQDVETWDTETNHTYEDFSAHYCGTIALRGVDKDGEQIWEVDKNAPDPGDFYKTLEDDQEKYRSPSR